MQPTGPSEWTTRTKPSWISHGTHICTHPMYCTLLSRLHAHLNGLYIVKLVKLRWRWWRLGMRIVFFFFAKMKGQRRSSNPPRSWVEVGPHVGLMLKSGHWSIAHWISTIMCKCNHLGFGSSGQNIQGSTLIWIFMILYAWIQIQIWTFPKSKNKFYMWFIWNQRLRILWIIKYLFTTLCKLEWPANL